MVLKTHNNFLLSVLISESSGYYIFNNIENSSIKLFDDCPICLKPKINCVIQKCGHMFHQKCINKWNNIKTNCPMCKNNIDKIISISDYFNYESNKHIQ
jgi:hypothetical protein